MRNSKVLKSNAVMFLAAIFLFGLILEPSWAGKTKKKDFYVKVKEIESLNASGKSREPSSALKKKKKKKKHSAKSKNHSKKKKKKSRPQ